MDKRKKKSRRKFKPVSSADNLDNGVDNPRWPHDGGTVVGLTVSEDHFSSKSRTSCYESKERSLKRTGKEVSSKCANRSTELPQDVDGETEISDSLRRAESDAINLVGSTNHVQDGGENDHFYAVEEKGDLESCQVEGRSVQNVGQIVELAELQEMLTLEKLKSDKLQIYLQRDIADREALEIGMRAEIREEVLHCLVETQAERERLSAENVELRSLIRDDVCTREDIGQLTTEIQRLTAKNLELHCLVDGREGEVVRLSAENLELQKSLVGTQAEARRLVAEVEQLSATNVELVGAQKELEWLTGEKQRLESENQGVKAENERLQNLIIAQEEEIERFITESLERQKMIVKYKEEIEMLEEEGTQMTKKITTLQSGMQQLEQKASVRANVGEDLGAASTVERWDGWIAKDPLAIAAAVAEESRLQKMAVMQTVEKLLQENNELIKKVNEQAAAINELTSESLGIFPSRFGNSTVPRAKNVDREEPQNMNAYAQNDVKRHKQGVAPKDENKWPPVVGSPVNNAVIETCLSERKESFRFVTWEQEIIPVQSISSQVEVSTNVEESSGQSKPVSGAGAQIMKAPFRFISFVAGYVSGKDLVKE